MNHDSNVSNHKILHTKNINFPLSVISNSTNSYKLNKNITNIIKNRIYKGFEKTNKKNNFENIFIARNNKYKIDSNRNIDRMNINNLRLSFPLAESKIISSISQNNIKNDQKNYSLKNSESLPKIQSIAEFRNINILKLEKQLKSEVKCEYLISDHIRSDINTEDKFNYFTTATSSEGKEKNLTNSNYVHKPCRSNMDFLFPIKDSKSKMFDIINNKNISRLSRNNSLSIKTPVSYIFLSSYNLNKEKPKSLKKSKKNALTKEK